jgi:hypothetical protein
MPLLTKRQLVLTTWSFAGFSVVLFILGHAQTLQLLADRCLNQPQYQYTGLIPWIAGALLIARWPMQQKIEWEVNARAWIMVSVLSIIQTIWLPATIEWLQVLTMIVMVGGIFVNIGGLNALKWAWPALVYLLFLVPLPATVELHLRSGLEQLNTSWASYALQTCGILAVVEGGTIRLPSGGILTANPSGQLNLAMLAFALQMVLILQWQGQRLGRLIATFNAAWLAAITTGIIWVWNGLWIEFMPGFGNGFVGYVKAEWVVIPLSVVILVTLQQLGLNWLTTVAPEQPKPAELAV